MGVRILGLFLNSELRTGGHRRYLELMEDLAARGNQVTVVLNERLAYEARSFTALRVRAPYVRRGFPPASLIFKAALRSRLRDLAMLQPQWILIHGETHLPAAAYVKRALGCKLLFGIRSNVVRWSAIAMKESLKRPLAFLSALKEQLIYRGYECLAARAADALVFQSGYDRDDFLSRVKATVGRPLVIGGNIGGPRFDPAYAGVNTSYSLAKLLFVGTLGERKGLRYLIEALGILSSRGINGLELDVLGPGEGRERYQSLADSLGFTGSIRFHGRVADPFPFYRDADLLVVPSLFDSYPDTVLEALHVGTPAIATRTGGIPDQLAYDELLVPIRDAKALADVLEAPARDKAAYACLRRLCASRRAAFDFDWAAAWEAALV